MTTEKPIKPSRKQKRRQIKGFNNAIRAFNHELTERSKRNSMIRDARKPRVVIEPDSGEVIVSNGGDVPPEVA